MTRMGRITSAGARLALSAAILLGWIPEVAPAYTPPIAEKRLTVTPNRAETSPVLSGKRVVYSSHYWDDFSNRVYVQDVVTGSRASISAGLDGSPYGASISGAKVVFLHDASLYVYDIERRSYRDIGYTGASTTDVSRDIVVYSDGDVYSTDIGGASVKRLTTGGSTNPRGHADVSGHRVVYHDRRNGNSDIFLHDLAARREQRLTFGSSEQVDPAISGQNVVYSDRRSGNWDVYALDLLTRNERRLTSHPSDQVNPAIYGSKVVWTDYRNGNGDIYLYDLAASIERRLTTNSAEQANASISGGRVAWEDGRHLGTATPPYSDIYVGTLQCPTLSASAPNTVGYRRRAKLTGRLRSSSGKSMSGRTIVLEMSKDGHDWTPAGVRTKTSSTGRYSLTSPRLKSARYLRANYRGSSSSLSAQSAGELVKPKVYLTRPSFSRKTLSRHKTYKARGYCMPRHKKGVSQVLIKAYKRSSSGKWVHKKTYRATASDYKSYTRYTKKIRLKSRGRWRLRAVHPADGTNAKTYSKWRYVTVR